MRHIIQSLKGQPVAIISGLALGIDSIAHSTALEIGLPCIAIPGSGLDKDVLYPRTHLELAESILKHGGLLLSEFEPNTRASPWSFPMRNRIMAGLSHVVLIIEGEEDQEHLSQHVSHWTTIEMCVHYLDLFFRNLKKDLSA